MKKLLPLKITAPAFLVASFFLSPARAEQSERGTPIPHGPVYPHEMVKKNVEAVVVVKTDVNTEGRTAGCRVVSSTNTDFNTSALDYCRKARYSPATKNGLPVVEYGKTLTVRYRLDD
ncbi:energy transducer TonB [Acetobacter persici]|uniref:energy transducer TonB n=1 Tax=Acetobacter persici TaxID=1076596 RepID=UPI0020CED889|nr:energy transducer TonB [Acetobacter persici]MCP9319846.1 energy transducer TonB [Acetobacter persici]